MTHRVALLGIYHESNTFIDAMTTMTDFVNGHTLYGDTIREAYKNAYHEIGGMLEVMDAASTTVVPVFFAEATPGGTIAAETSEWLFKELFGALETVMPVDGCLVVVHGAAVSESCPDMDGEWLERLRQRVGPHVPIVGTLDLHANLSQRMVNSTNALVAYTKNPHIDQRERGKEAARLLLDMLDRRSKPIQRLRQLPLAISIEQQHTEKNPCKAIYAYAKRMSAMDGVLSISITLGFPYADVHEMGTAVLVITDEDKQKADALARQIETYILHRKAEFVGDKLSIDEALNRSETMSKPVLLLDMGDNVGGGSPGNGVALLEALEGRRNTHYLMCLHDPDAVVQVRQMGLKGKLVLSGYNINGRVKLSIAVERILEASGVFHEENPRHGGQARYNMGDIAVVSTENGGRLLLTSLRVPPFSLSQLTTFGMDPKHVDAVVAKGVNAPIAAYASVCPSIIQVDTPGVTQADMTQFNYLRRRKPLYPFEQA